MRKSIKYLVFLFLFLSFINFVYAQKTTIYDIQYTTTPGSEGTYPSPMEGETVTVIGIVTAANYYSSGNDNRFFITDEDGGPWHGVFVFNWDSDVELGDEVEVTGEVSEFYGYTEINPTSIITNSSSNPVPAPTIVNTGELVDPVDAEQYEGCLVKVQNVEVTQEAMQYGQWYVDDGSGECQIDDGMFSYTPTLGENISSITGALDYSYDEYGINPRSGDDLGVTPGTIEGTITLNGGSGNVEDVEVTAGGVSTNPDSSGGYQISITPGTYDVTASLSGYSSQTLENVNVESTETTSNIDFSLEWEETTIVIDSIQYFPEIVFTDDSITVSAKTTPHECSLIADTLVYKINDGEYQKIEMDSIDLFRYSCIIPPANETGELLFYVKAVGKKEDESAVLSTSSEIAVILYPRDPIISNITSNESNDSIFVEASIIDYDGLVQNVYLKCRLDYFENYFTYPMVADTVDTTLYVGIIPLQAQGSTIYYYICAVDDSGLVSCEGDAVGEPFEYQYDVISHKAVLIVDHHTFCPTLGEKFEIQFHSRVDDKIILRLYNCEGKLVHTFRNEVNEDGLNSYEWNGKDETWNTLPPGLYICHLEVIDRNTGKTKTNTVPIVIAAPLKN